MLHSSVMMKVVKYLRSYFLPCSETLAACDFNWWGIVACHFFLVLISNNRHKCKGVKTEIVLKNKKKM